MADPTTTPGAGQQDPADAVGEFNPIAFAIAQAIANISTVKIVKVMAVDTDAHTVDVQIAVNQLDGNSNSTPHGTINAVPYVWIMGGTNAYEIDPAKGDMGLMLVSDRDISAVRAAKAIANPGSLRKFDVSDGLYLFGVPGLNGQAPTQFFKWIAGGGYNITDSFGNVQQSTNAGISINGVVFNRTGQVAGNLPVTGAIELAGSINALDGTEYAGNFTTTGVLTAADIILNPGASQVTGRGHIHPANGSPPTPGH